MIRLLPCGSRPLYTQSLCTCTGQTPKFHRTSEIKLKDGAVHKENRRDHNIERKKKERERETKEQQRREKEKF